MNKKLIILSIALIILLLPLIAFSNDDIKCPRGTIMKGETTIEVSEAWCEMYWQDKTVEHGPYWAWYPNGVLGTKGQYDHGKAIGTWYGFYDTGEKQGEEIFVKGKKVSAKYWDKNGNPIKAVKNIKSRKE
jgi:hypothetical protein